MKEPFSWYLAKLVGKKEDCVTHLSPERAPTPKKISNDSSESHGRIQQAKGCDRASNRAGKTKKHHIPFGALALVLLFSCLCIVSLVGKQPLARATAHSSSVTLHHAASQTLQDKPTSTADCIVDDCDGALPAVRVQWANYTYGYSNDCQKSYFYNTFGEEFCSVDKEFKWGNRDVTCVEFQDPSHAVWPIPLGRMPTSSTPAATPGANNGSSGPYVAYNQNSCTDNFSCYSDNRSGQDSDGSVHNLLNGDDVICYNASCINQGGDSTHAICGGAPYDKFGCAPIPNGQGFYYNPTAFDPFADMLKPNDTLALQSNGQGKGTDTMETAASGDMPTCDDGTQKWKCPNNDAIYLALTMTARNFLYNPFTNDGQQTILSNLYEVVSSGPSFNPADYDRAPAISYGILHYEGASDEVDIGAREPVYEVGCDKNNTTGSVFPCTDDANGNVNQQAVQNDWLSGDKDANGAETHPGHLSVTYADETRSQTNLMNLYSLTLALGFTLTIPAIILIGYQLLWSSWTLGRVASMEMFARLLLSFLAVAMSYELTTMLIGLSNVVSHAIVTLHSSLGYPDIKVNNDTVNLGDGDSSSFRGIVIPVNRWGCVMNDFMEVLAQKLGTDLLGFVPFFGGFIKLFKGISDAIQALKHIGEFIELLLSINLAVQVFVRVVLVNYYILTAPVAFGCWGLPGGFGQRVVGQWFKGFCSVLFTQGVQLFVLTTLPLLLPSLPVIPVDTFGIFTIILKQLPGIIVLMAVIKVPSMMGTQATKAIAQAGSVSSGAVAALGAAAYQVV